MKKTIATVLSAALLMSCLVSCGSSTSTSTSTSASGSTGSSSAPAESKEKIVLQLGHVNPNKETDHMQYCCTQFASYLDEYSDGAFQIDIFTDSLLGNDREMIEGMQIGTVNMGLVANCTMTAFSPALQILDLPYLYNTVDEGYAVLDDEAFSTKLVDECYEDCNIKVLGWMYGGYRNVISNIGPVNSVEDVQGMKLRLLDSALFTAVWKSIGAAPLTMAYSEVPTAIQQGTIDGFELPISSTVSSGFHEYCDCYSKTEHVFYTMPFCISGADWEALTAEQQEWVQKAATNALIDSRAFVANIEKTAEQVCEDAGMEVNEVEDKSEFIARAQECYGPVIDEIGQDYLDQVNAIIDAM